MKWSILEPSRRFIARSRLIISLPFRLEVQVRDGRLALLDHVVNTKPGYTILLSSGWQVVTMTTWTEPAIDRLKAGCVW